MRLGVCSFVSSTIPVRLHINKSCFKDTNVLILPVTTKLTKIIEAKKEAEVETTPLLTQAGRAIGGDLVARGANALEAALSVDALPSTAQQRVPFTLVNV